MRTALPARFRDRRPPFTQAALDACTADVLAGADLSRPLGPGAGSLGAAPLRNLAVAGMLPPLGTTGLLRATVPQTLALAAA